MIQGTEEWFKTKRGNIGASRISDVMAGKETASRKNYMVSLLVERLTDKQEESYTNAAMQWGTDNEPLARSTYEFLTGNKVEEVGFILHPTIERAGASPDGMVNDDGLIEIKCPNTSTHIEYLDKAVVPTLYKNQMTFQMMCTDRKWCDFVSFDPRLPVQLQTFIIRYDFDNDLANKIENGVKDFLKELSELENRMRSKMTLT